MCDRGHNGAAGQPALREDLRRLEAALARHEQNLRDALRTGDSAGAELLAHTATLLTEEIGRLRSLLF